MVNAPKNTFATLSVSPIDYGETLQALEEVVEVIKYYSQDETRLMHDIWDKDQCLRQQVVFEFDSKKAKEWLNKWNGEK